MFEKEKFTFQINDYQFFGSNALIGEVEIALAPIYFADNHSLLHQWAALTNSHRENRNDIQGFIKFSANLVGPGDQVSKLEAEIVKEDKNSQKIPVIYSPEVQTKTFQIRIGLLKGENFVKMDNFGGSIDSYIVFKFGSSSFKTEAIKNNQNPFWGYEILVRIFVFLLLFIIATLC